ncbi:MAG: hypothetical protein K6U74_16905 [Firmicutes bacterium]|nr:hypothetical protein [Bacillota bacterium]
MLKRLFAIAAVFIFLAAALPAFAGQLFNAQTAINEAVNNSGFYELKTKDGDDLNYVSIPILTLAAKNRSISAEAAARWCGQEYQYIAPGFYRFDEKRAGRRPGDMPVFLRT